MGTLGGGLALVDYSITTDNNLNDYTTNQLSIYPNPASKAILIKYNESDNSTISLNIYNVIGKLVYSKSVTENEQRIDLENLSDGIYTVECISKNGREVQKLIIRK